MATLNSSDPRTVRPTTGVRHITGHSTAHRAMPTPNHPSSVSRSGHSDPAEARALSKILFQRLDSLEEGTPQYSYVRNTLVELNLTLVHYVMGLVGTRNESHEDVVQVGTIGLIKAINRFDPQRGVEFPTFAVPTIMGEIKRYFRDATWTVHVPRRLRDMRLDLNKATTHLEQSLGRTPTVPELAGHLGLDEEEVIEGVVAANGYAPASLDRPDDAGLGDAALVDHLGYTDPDLSRAENVQALKPLIAALPERERRILALRYTADMTQSAIGAQLGISQMQVCRILKRTLARLRAQLATDPESAMR
ncbi:RNA polymerase sigma factor SigF [Streptomyces mexicanus]|jgi:RNA polymerase sigma-B factor